MEKTIFEYGDLAVETVHAPYRGKDFVWVHIGSPSENVVSQWLSISAAVELGEALIKLRGRCST